MGHVSRVEPSLRQPRSVAPGGPGTPGKDVGNVDVHAVGLHGGEPRVVASTPGQDFHPFFSPSGRWVYFQPDHKNIYRVPGPGQDWKRADPVKITMSPSPDCSWKTRRLRAMANSYYMRAEKITGDIWILKRRK